MTPQSVEQLTLRLGSGLNLTIMSSSSFKTKQNTEGIQTNNRNDVHTLISSLWSNEEQIFKQFTLMQLKLVLYILKTECFWSTV